MKLRKCFITFVVCASLVVPGIFTSCKHPASPKNDNTKVEEQNPENEKTPEEIDPSSEKNPDEENKDSQKTDDKTNTEVDKENEVTPETDKKEEENSEAGISLIQEETKEITKSEEGYTFTAPAGYAKYEWILRGQDILEKTCTPKSGQSNVCSLITDELKKGGYYHIEVRVYDSSLQLQDIFYYDFLYEEEK